MKMLKSLFTILICSLLLTLTQCKSNKPTTQVQEEILQDMEMRNPAFAKAQPTFHKWVAGVEGGGSGITMIFTWQYLPENIVMKEAYFRGHSAPIKQNQKGYTANFIDGTNAPEDMVMHSDATQEAVNTPPKARKVFPTALTNTQVGIIYEENGQLVYTIINNPMEKPQVALPTAPPRGEGF